MKIKLKIILFLSIIGSHACAQISDDQQRQLKYWYYRERLRTRFMLDIGSNHGESIPASFRTDYKTTPGGKWEEGADGTISLSYYIITLVTEYDLLTQNGQNTDATLNELFYALDAFNRLDYYADTWFNGSAGGALNGFFMREDLCFNCWDGTLQQRNSNYQNTVNYLNTKSGGTINALGAIWISSHEEYKPSFEMSIDQVLHLYLALTTIIKKIPSSIVPPYSGQVFWDSETTYNDEAQAIMKRIVDYLHTPGTLINTPWNWRIYDPWGDPAINGTASAWLQAPALSYANKTLANHNNPKSNIAKYDKAWKAQNKVYRYLVALPFVFHLGDQGLKFLNCMTFSGPNFINNNYIMPQSMKINLYSLDLGYKNVRIQVPIINQYLYGNLDWHGNPYYRDLLDAAPCYGPYNHSTSCSDLHYQTWDWSSSNLLVEPQRRGDCSDVAKEDNHLDFPGDYNGLDYMVLYNLFCLTKNEPIKKYFFDLYNNNMITDFPTSSNYGSSSDPADIISHNTIVAGNHISSSGDVEYRAGKSIDFTTNFTVDPQAKFYAHIDDVECVGGGDEFERNMQTNQAFVGNSVSKNKKQKTSVITTVNFEASAFPVPFSNNFNVSLSVKQPCIVTIALRSADGKLVKELFVNSVDEGEIFLTFSTENIELGFYLVTIEALNQSKTLKLIKSK